MPVKLKLAASAEVGAPKPTKASKKNKKSWRKNVDMTEVNEFLEEKRFEERTGGSVADKPDEALFTLDTNVESAEVTDTRNKRRENKKLRCFAALEGLPGAPDPVPVRNHTLTPEQRMNPIVKDMKMRRIKEGKIQKKHLDRVKDRKQHLERKEAMKEEAKKRRRTTFDFDLWADDDQKNVTNSAKLPDNEWVNTEAMIHSAIGQYAPLIRYIDGCYPLPNPRHQPARAPGLADEDSEQRDQAGGRGGPGLGSQLQPLAGAAPGAAVER